MSTKEAYKQKLDAELEIAKARLDEFKAKAKSMSADTRINYDKHLEELEHSVQTAKAKLTELGEAGGDGWEKLKEGVEKAVKGLSNKISDVTEKFRHH